VRKIQREDLFFKIHTHTHTHTHRYIYIHIHGHNPSGRTMALGSTQPLTEMSTRNISWVVKAAGA